MKIKTTTAFRALNQSRLEARDEQGTHIIRKVLKSGALSKAQHIEANGRASWTEQEARSIAKRLNALNPNSTFVVIAK